MSLLITKDGRSQVVADSTREFWRGAGWLIVGDYQPPTPNVAQIDDSSTLATPDPPDTVAWSADHARSQILALLTTSSFLQAVAGAGSNPGTPAAGLVKDTDGVYYLP